jgi:translation initiation factor IF-2
MQQKRAPGTVQPKSSKIVVTVPITVRSLSEAMGVRSGELLFKLRDHGINAMNLNLTVEPEMAELLALAYDKELEIKRPLTTEEELIRNPKLPDNPEDLVPRAPVVTIMGHVDHGKTSLLDKIRHSNVTATEAGGITQMIRAWRVDYNGKPITFLDTPGHEAFTKMRARGANVTDIAVIVVAADDGVMPQTEEAILHAKAAGVSLIVAINKVDLPNANLNKTRQQLYGLDVLPDNMGGDVPFVETSAATGKGIDDLLESILLVAELKELKANPKKTAEGTCLEAELDEQEGVQATLLVQSGTLRRGDVLVCGATFGRVRAMYSDLGKPIDEAGPSMPCRVTGLDEVPNADDRFMVVPDLALGREIAEARKEKAHEISTTRRTLSLDMLGEQKKITELKVILKADFRGSVEAIRKELEKLQHEEVKVRVLSAGIGGITENDVNLALTSPQDTLIVGFNVVPDDNARRLAEERGISLREYSIIYNLTNDVKAAMEGRLKPEEKVVNLGRAMVRDTFKISRVGTIAGCYVTQGTIERSAKVRVIRDGVVIYPPAERTAGLESLKRFKDDAREVREGFECGLKVAGYDDIKVGDVIEAFRVEQVQRTLDS